MSCYTFEFDKHVFNVSSSNIEGETQIQSFIRAIENLKESQPSDWTNLVNLLQSTYNVGHQPDERHNRNIPFMIKNNLQKVGIQMEVLNELNWHKFCEEQSVGRDIKINPNSQSFVLDGVIYVRQLGFKTTDTLHELSHFLLAVLRASKNGFEKYKSFINTLYCHPEVQKIAKTIQLNTVYSGQQELDFEEEAVVRYLELLFEDKINFDLTFEVNNQKIDLVDLLNDTFQETIENTFGITKYPGFITMFKSLISETVNYGNNGFELPKMSTIGYMEAKKQATESARISALINYYLSDEGGNLLTQICK